MHRRWLVVGLGLGGLFVLLGWVWYRYNLDVVAKVVSVVLPVSGLVAAIVKWRPATLVPQALLEELAAAVCKQWQDEEKIRRLEDPRPLPVRWSNTARLEVMDYWEVIHGADDCTTPLDLSGRLDQIAEVFDRVPSRRLVVLGEPGAGKTVLAMHFTLECLRRRCAGEPVPVLLSIASWNPREQSLYKWMATRLSEDYPKLGTRTASDSTVAWDLVTAGHVLPVLDGLDEAPPAARAAAIMALNRTLSYGDPILLTCRADDYAAVVEAADDVLTAAAVIEIAPLKLDDAEVYLRVTAPTRRGMNKWDPAFAHLRGHPDEPLAQVLTNPLMASLARIAYSDQPADPAQLLGNAELSTRGSIEEHLLDQLIPSAFSDYPTTTSSRHRRWRQQDAQRWLTFLAVRLDRRGTRDLAWWELHQTLPQFWFKSASGVMVGLAAGLGATLLGWFTGASESDVLLNWLYFGLMSGFLVGIFPPRSGSMARELGFRGRLRRFLIVGLVFGLVTVLVSWRYYHTFGLTVVLKAVLVFWPYNLAFGLAFASAVSFFPPPSGIIAHELGFRGRLRRFLIVGLVFMFVFVLAAGVGLRLGLRLGLVTWSGTGPELASVFKAGLASAVAVGFIIGFLPSPSGPTTLEFGFRGRLGRLLAFGLVVGFMIGLASGLSVGLLVEGGLEDAIMAGLKVGIVVALVVGPVVGLFVVGLDTPSVLDRAITPSSSLRLDRAAAVLYSLAFGFVAGLAAWPFFGLDIAPPYGLGTGLAGWFAFGLTSFFSTASGRLMIVQVWLWLQGQLPLRVMLFLNEAHRRGALRQVGGVYQFRHARLQDRLAAPHRKARTRTEADVIDRSAV